VWGEELYFDATKIEANASLESIVPRFAVEHHLQDLPQDSAGALGDAARAAVGDVDALPTSKDAELALTNAAKSDWISRAGSQDRVVQLLPTQGGSLSQQDRP
jgi:hypothetical protein